MKMINNVSLSLILGLLFVTVSLAQPKGEDIVIGKSYTMTSGVLNEERPYLVYLPSDYDEKGPPISVMYVLDGNGHFHHATGVVSFLRNQGRIPNMMVVAIPNTADRTRDLTPPIEKDMNAAKQFPTAGGADNMLAFIKDELMPLIDENYNVGPYKILMGHSFGGIFAVHSLLKEPELFDAYLSISPSMWWDDQRLVTDMEAFLAKDPKLDSYFYMTMGNEDGTMLGGAMKLAALFEEMKEGDFMWDFKVMKEETHGSIPHRSLYYGLESIFEDWFSIDYQKLYADGGLDKVKAHFENVSKKLGYAVLPEEGQLNTLGYFELGNKRTSTALDIFLENIKLYPTSFNTYDSAAEAYMANGEMEKAITYYKKSMELNPGNINGIDMLKKLGITYDPEEFAVKLNEAEQKTYAGDYAISVGGVMTIKIVEGKLMASHPAIPSQSMLYYGNNLFLMVPQNVPVTFMVDEEKNPVGFNAQLGIGNLVKGKKIIAEDH
jgi:predicted alpha/beta superfamily hydrolase